MSRGRPAKPELTKLNVSDFTEKSQSGCMTWIGKKDSKGYCRYKGELVHRTVWKLHFGEIPEKIVIMHSCGNLACCNIDHLCKGERRDKQRAPSGIRSLTADQIEEAKNLKQQGWSFQKISNHFGVSIGTAHNLVGKVSPKKTASEPVCDLHHRISLLEDQLRITE